MTKYKHETVVNADIKSTFDWFEDEGSFRRLMPPWEVAEEVRADDSLEVGSQRIFRFPAPGIPFVNMTWVAEHTGYDKPNYFADTMIKGPFWKWNHNHYLTEKDGVTTVVDDVRKIALNLDLPAKISDSLNLYPSLMFILNFPIKTKPSFTMIPISAITPSKEIMETEKLWIQCPHATPTKLTGINKKSKIG